MKLHIEYATSKHLPCTFVSLPNLNLEHRNTHHTLLFLFTPAVQPAPLTNTHTLCSVCVCQMECAEDAVA